MAAFLNRAVFSKQLAHTTMLPALGNQDLKLLQDLITAEKSVILSWGSGEGDDLADVLEKSRVLLGAVSGALSQLAAHGTTIRVHMKEVRRREENLSELQRTRKQVGVKTDAAEKKLSKMNPGHKQQLTQRDLINQLREEGRQLDETILAEEAGLGDYKRQTTKDWMTVKFGGLCELAEKVMIVGNTGKQLIEAIPLDQTKPGSHRAPYLARTRTTDLLTSFGQKIEQVKFQSTPSDFAHRHEPEAAGLQGGQLHHFAEPHMANNVTEFGQFPGGISGQPQPFIHTRALTTAAERDLNPTAPPYLHNRSLSLPNSFDGRLSHVIQPRSLASTFHPQSRPSYMPINQPGRSLDSVLNDPGTDPASGLRSTTPTPGRRSAVGFHSIEEEPDKTGAQPAFHPPQSGTASATLANQQRPPHSAPSTYSRFDQQTFSANDTQQQAEGSPARGGSPEPDRSQAPPSLSLSFSGEDSRLSFPGMM
ncbi:hypothetical protein FRC01_005734 [Tulasnella sp. 417]|nr:hypothetical protein FRC01_005734 [Tulasnella sp. 417]